jgi:hypothetical protein
MRLFLLLILIPSLSVGQDFGLGSHVSYTTNGAFGLGLVKQEKAKPVEVSKPIVSKPILKPIIRQAKSNWVDSSVGDWTADTLRRHLLGELSSNQHRGQVPAAELQGRSLRELIDIHDNLHEGYLWHGELVVVQMKTVEINCPGGVCPVPQRQVRRLFRR